MRIRVAGETTSRSVVGGVTLENRPILKSAPHRSHNHPGNRIGRFE